MVKYFEKLNEQEFEQLRGIIALVTIYVAGADGRIDHKETEWAEKITRIRSFSSQENLDDFYKAVGVDFHDKLVQLIDELPDDVAARSEIIESQFVELSTIMDKLDPRIAARLYRSVSSFSKHVAKSDGGFLRFFGIGPNEYNALKLKGLKEFTYNIEEEE